MSPFRNTVQKYQLTLFFLLSYLLSWWTISLAHGLLSHGVMFAALTTVWFVSGKTGLRVIWNRLTNFQSGWLYLSALVIVVVFKFFNAFSSFLSGASFSGFPSYSFVEMAIELLLLGGLWEEPGWSGYALPVLQKRFVGSRYGILIATLILGVFRGIWHIPLVLVGAIPWYDALWFTPFVFQPFISWLYNKSKGSVPVVMLFHYLSNLIFGMGPNFEGGNVFQYTFLYMALGGVATIVLIWKTKFELGWSEK